MGFDLTFFRKSPAARTARIWRRFAPGFVRAVPIRWLLFSMAGFTAIVAIILAVLIWTGANALSGAREDVRKMGEANKVLGLLESETGRLQSLIHRYLNQPSEQLLAEILSLHGEVLSTLRGRGAGDPVLSGFTDELRAATERFLQGFGELREAQRRILETYEHEVLKPVEETVSLLAAAEATIGRSDSPLLWSLQTLRDTVTASLVAANAYYTSLDPEALENAQQGIAQVEQAIPKLADLAENDTQRSALEALSGPAASFRDGLKTLSQRCGARTHLLKAATDGNLAAMSKFIESTWRKMALLETQAQDSFDRALANIYENGALVAVLFLTLAAVLWRLQRMIETRRTSDLLDAHRRLAAQWSRLRQANALKSEVLGTVAHDLKNPLAVILGRTEILKDMIVGTGELDRNLQAQIKQIRASADRLAGMVDDLLADAMADALDITLRRESVDIVLLVQEVTEANRSLAAHKQQTITVTAPPNATVVCDSDRMREAIDNLVSNAIKYSPIGGAIDLRVAQENDALLIEVRDRGAGLSPEDVSRMFGRFQRLSAKPSAGESSTGLGLSIVKRIVDLHGGQITVESAGPGQGAAFRISLPTSVPTSLPTSAPMTAVTSLPVTLPVTRTETAANAPELDVSRIAPDYPAEPRSALVRKIR